MLTWSLDTLGRMLPAAYRPAVSTFRLLNLEYAHLETVRRKACVDNRGTPIPWYTYPAIEYIRQIDWSEKTVFEYGCGNSTLFWAGLARRVTSVESDAAWFETIRSRLPAHCDLLLEPEMPAYARAVERQGGTFDVIVVDGRHRREAAERALPFLAHGGLVILDNSDWYPKTSEVLREANLLEVDMSGFGPINDYTWTTSFYFHRDFAWKPADRVQPRWGLGSIHQFASDE